MHRIRIVLPACALIGLLLGVACREVAGPPQSLVAPAFDVTASVDVAASNPIFTTQLRAVPPDPIMPISEAWGQMQLSLITVPPEPIMPGACVQTDASTDVGSTAAALCGQVHNPAGQTFLSATLFSSAGREGLAVQLDGFGDRDQPPTSDCPLVDIEADLQIPDALAAALQADPGEIKILFRSKEFPEGSIAGGFGNEPAGPIQTNPGASGIQRLKGSPCKIVLRN